MRPHEGKPDERLLSVKTKEKRCGNAMRSLASGCSMKPRETQQQAMFWTISTVVTCTGEDECMLPAPEKVNSNLNG
uniref:Uncharacterized protein n=1 Tax=Nelumbo nucifera TaxID=4432 RepID=A0A822Y8S8_NELNU|nr:TPA_asm: hypothetical protein HUJ06_009315 [Nelumbo nucifera]